MLIAAICTVSLLFFSCSGDDNNNNGQIGGKDTDSGSDPEPSEEQWEIERISSDAGVGLQAKIAIGPNDAPGLAFFENKAFDDGICNEIETDPPIRRRQNLYFAEKQNLTDKWSVDLVDKPVVILEPAGLSLAFAPNGAPALAYTGGIPQKQYCGGNNAVLAIRGSNGTWTTETASAQSSDSATGDVASDAGFVVGFWPAVAFDSKGQPAIIHQDIHFGLLQSDDIRRTDAEFAWKTGGSWSHEAIDFGEGAGDYNAILFDSTDTPIVFYTIPVEVQMNSRKGVWAARRSAAGDWDEKVQLYDGSVYKKISVARNPVTGNLTVAYYAADQKAVQIRTCLNDDDFADATAWTTEIVGKAQYDEGRYVSLAFTSTGQTVLAYHRCKRLTSTAEGCDQNDEAVVFALKTGNDWNITTIRNADVGSCGEYTSLAIDSANTAYVAFRCTEQDGTDFMFKLFVASKKLSTTP